ncbi:MAG: RelA/SpoT family protein [Methylococcales bacterium]
MSDKTSDPLQGERPNLRNSLLADRLTSLTAGLSEADSAPIAQALEIPVRNDQSGPARPEGVDVALILKHLGVDPPTLTAAILSDSRLQNELDLKEIERTFGSTVANLVRNVRWLNTFNVYSPEVISNPDQAEILRRMLLAMVDDVRAVLIKLAFRVERLRNLSSESYEVGHYIARETLELYSRLANRLGIGQLKWELEDLAFRYLNPQIYRKIAASLTESRASREAYLKRVVDILKDRLQAEGIGAELSGRPKHIYSIWKKMQRKQVDFKDVYDLRAVRILVDQVSTCYSTLGFIHGLWQYIPGEFDDYIATPKTNGYQSLHTVVVGPEAAMVEIQIRTRAMDQFANLGVAAHWRYKEGGKHEHAVVKSIESLRKLLDNKDDGNHLLDDFKTDLYTGRIFVLTPTGELKELPKGATPLDFAYLIHTEIGHRCRGAKVNRKIVPLSYTLQSGDQVEILTSREAEPKRSWLDSSPGYLKTPGARSKVRQWFRKQDRERNLRDGKAILEKLCRQNGIKQIDQAGLVKHFRVSQFDELLAAIGRAEFSPEQLGEALIPPEEVDEMPAILSVRKSLTPAPGSDVNVHGVENLLTSFAQCCKPVAGDPIIGYISGAKGVAIHRRNCKNIDQLPERKQNRLIKVDWGDNPQARTVDVLVRAMDRSGLLRDVTQILANEQIHIRKATSRPNPKDHTVNIKVTLEVVDSEQLTRTLEKINRLPHILEAGRKG